MTNSCNSIYCRCPDSFLFFSFKVLHDTYFWLQLCIVYSKLPFLCSLYTVSTQYTRILGSGVFDQDQNDLNNTDAFFILDEEVSRRAPSVPQTVQHFLHGEVLLSAYFPMPTPAANQWLFRCYALQSRSSCRIQSTSVRKTRRQGAGIR